MVVLGVEVVSYERDIPVLAGSVLDAGLAVDHVGSAKVHSLLARAAEPSTLQGHAWWSVWPAYLAESVCKVVLQNSIPAQIDQRILHHHKHEDKLTDLCEN